MNRTRNTRNSLPPRWSDSSSSSNESETHETPPIDQFKEALEQINNKERRGAISFLLEAKSMGEVVWVCMNATSSGKAPGLARRVSILGIIKRLWCSCESLSTQASLLAFANLGNLASSVDFVDSTNSLVAYVQVLPDRIPDAMKPYAVQILDAFDERYRHLLKGGNEKKKGLYRAIKAKVKGYRDQIRTEQEQGRECRPADDVRPPASMASQAKRERADEHQQVIEDSVYRKKSRPALPDMPSTLSDTPQATRLPPSTWQVSGQVMNIGTVVNMFMPLAQFTPLTQFTPLRPQQQSAFDPMEPHFPMADLPTAVPVEPVPLPNALQFPRVAANLAEHFERNPRKRVWLERLSSCRNVAALGDLHLMSEEWQLALAAVLTDLGASSSRQAATTELALGILSGASGALSPELYEQIAAVLSKSTEWPASIPSDFEHLGEIDERHPVCIPVMANLINRCLGTVK